MEGKVVLCSTCRSCPAVEFTGDGVRIGEDQNLVVLTRKEWNLLVAKIKSGELQAL